MKLSPLLVVAAGLGLAAGSGARAGDLPRGTYAVVLQTETGCPLGLTGLAYLVYPGVGEKGTELDFFAAGEAQDGLSAFTGFPSVPPGGIAGWTTTSPASIVLTHFLGGHPGTPTAEAASFAIHMETHAVWRLSMTLTGGSCPGTTTYQLIRTGRAT